MFNYEVSRAWFTSMYFNVPFQRPVNLRHKESNLCEGECRMAARKISAPILPGCSQLIVVSILNINARTRQDKTNQSKSRASLCPSPIDSFDVYEWNSMSVLLLPSFPRNAFVRRSVFNIRIPRWRTCESAQIQWTQIRQMPSWTTKHNRMPTSNRLQAYYVISAILLPLGVLQCHKFSTVLQCAQGDMLFGFWPDGFGFGSWQLAKKIYFFSQRCGWQQRLTVVVFIGLNNFA